MPVTKRKTKKTKKAKTATLTGRTVTIRYRCNGSCKALPRRAHMRAGDVVNMLAINTNVRITFIGASPFQSGASSIIIRAGGIRTEIVGAATGSFPYNLSCPTCPTGNIPPEMIVP